ATVETKLGLLRGRAGPGVSPGRGAKLYVRPETLVPGNGGENALAATVERIDFEGAFALAHGRFDDGAALVASIPSTGLADAPRIGSRASFGFATRHAMVLSDG